jgi:hypothetical protein
MVSQSPGIYILLAAVLSSVSLLINNWINHKFQLERENQQRIWQQESEKQKWYREKIYESYRNSIHILTKIIQAKFPAKLRSEYDDSYNEDYDLELTVLLKNLYFEFTSEFSIILVGHPYKDSKELNEIIGEILDESMEKNPFMARVVMTRMMESDPRIKDVNKGYLNSENTLTDFKVI